MRPDGKGKREGRTKEVFEVKGKVTKVNMWKSGKGAFIQIDGAKPDYVFYGTPLAKIGDEVEFEEGAPTKDGKPVIKKLVVKLLCGPVEAFEAPARDEDRTKPTPVLRAHDAPKADAREQYWINKEKHDLVKDAVITRLSCISSACVLLHDTGREDDALALAAKFEKFAKGEKA